LLARRLPHAVLRVVPGAGHFFLVADDPRPAAAAIEEFLDAQPDGSACT
jgi:pimeloyl-ACP methyl ester carboxylesterase